jgi:hypothetical protein
MPLPRDFDVVKFTPIYKAIRKGKPYAQDCNLSSYHGSASRSFGNWPF